MKNILKSISLGALLIGALGNVAIAQKPKPTVDVNEKSRKVGKEVNEAYKNWKNKDVDYIITKEERKAFDALQTDEERENFIENFWRRRDPNPDTEENEYREEYYERIAYANEKFASGIPGWKTDRGRIYITFGKPDSVESHPSGGSYDRPSYEGGGTTTTYPFEIWFYRHLDDVGDGLEIEFVDPTGSGEYRIARNANEKDALLFVPGAGQTLGEQLGTEDRADRISGINNNNRTYGREQDSPFRRLEILGALQRPPKVKYGDLQESLTDSTIDNNPLEFNMRVDFFRQSDDRVITAFTIQTDNTELSFPEVGGFPTAQMNIFGRVTAVSGKRSGIFEDSVSTTSSTEDLVETKQRKSIYQKAIALTPGTYKVDVIVRDVESNSRGIRSIGFTVPKYDSEKLGISTLVLASKLYATTERDIGAMFVIGSTKVVPNLSGQFKQGQDVGIYMQIYNAGIDQTTLRPAVDVEYTLYRGGKEIMSAQKEDWSGLSDSGQRLTISRLLPTGQLPIGDYELKIKVRDRVKPDNKVEEPSAKFSIVK